jgi:hypothetical protein
LFTAPRRGIILYILHATPRRLRPHGIATPTPGEIVSDTSPAADTLQLAAQRGLRGEQRLALALEMSRLARQLLLTRLGQQHPDWTRAELERELLRSAFVSEGRTVELPLPLR